LTITTDIGKKNREAIDLHDSEDGSVCSKRGFMNSLVKTGGIVHQTEQCGPKKSAVFECGFMLVEFSVNMIIPLTGPALEQKNWGGVLPKPPYVLQPRNQCFGELQMRCKHSKLFTDQNPAKVTEGVRLKTPLKNL